MDETIQDYLKSHGHCKCFVCKALDKNPKEIEETLFCNVCHKRKHIDHFQLSTTLFVCEECEKEAKKK